MDIVFQEVVLHQIPKKLSGGAPPPPIEFSDEPASLDAQTSRFLREELLEKPLSADARTITQSPAESLQAVPTLIRSVFADSSNSVSGSQAIATQLLASQGASASSGLIMIALATADGRPCLIISKVEHQEGVHLQPQVDDATGHRVFDVELLRQLIIGRNARVYKIGLIWAPTIVNEPLRGLLVDRQNGRSFAAYFLGPFLGFELTEQSEVLTKRFADGVQRAISQIPDPQKQARYEVALLAELSSNDELVHPLQFLQHHIDEGDQGLFESELATITDEGHTFGKDLRLMGGMTTRARVQTAGGATIILPTEMLESGAAKITASDGSNTQARIEIKDEIESWSGAPNRRA
jgi:hypothetical protein